MASGQLSRAEALACLGCRHACHVMLYCDTKSQLFGRLPIRHIILMQMRFDGLLGFPGGFVNPSKETLEAGLSRELLEELGVTLPILVEDHVDSYYAPASSSSSSRLITHFYVKKMEEEQIREVERAAASTAADHGQEVLGMVRVPLYTMKGGGGLASFLSHSFVGSARSQLADSLLRFNLVAPEELNKVLTHSLKMNTHTADDLQAALELTEVKMNTHTPPTTCRRL
ncbi:U8 snoRNA-decapping enzyme isoform X1 [Sebastes umbrosus]|uniref:U8 snoRNA-decapping enzyme isoform X1 n=2 Tax=Sebastes umbrosus TaxID=72105 RepID=UPI00189F3E3B|nr:U8 snoRNA-decapping enzyme isoform X1 [Sebastes umbrosus]XP_037629747.1 U8 snoRNA-decapping enzyme isoform X1 [Sebastes umbrosus]